MDVENQTCKKDFSKYKRSVVAGIVCGVVTGGIIAACVIVMLFPQPHAQYSVNYVPDFLAEIPN